MKSWWDLGEWSGQHGDTLALYQITCPFCMERGNFSVAFDAEKKKPNGSKVLHFSTLQCGSCAGYVMALWSATSSHSNMHDYRVLPWPQRIDKAPEEWPPDVGRYWLQAHRSLRDENWDAAAVMARSSLQISLREQGATGNNLKQEIDDLGNKGLIPPVMRDWSHEVRELGNDSAHPTPGQAATSPRDAKDIVQFTHYLFEYLYTIPHRIAGYRARRSGGAT
ncbi:DUF4145 domain-containing protein [Novilysobacter erysipheiresistens]|uniref:DUF4145 domain-containing protein n=1 Tax=Novilysobacter erysipheiresistens TaxID=1749332 RepID=A0ABU7Z255_9GAMM